MTAVRGARAVPQGGDRADLTLREGPDEGSEVVWTIEAGVARRARHAAGRAHP